MKELSYMIYATQQEGGIRGDGRVGLRFPQGDLTHTEINRLIDHLQVVAKGLRGSSEVERYGKLSLEE